MEMTIKEEDEASLYGQINFMIYNDLVENSEVANEIAEEEVWKQFLEDTNVNFSFVQNCELEKFEKISIIEDCLSLLEVGRINGIACFTDTLCREEIPSFKTKFPSLSFYICVNERLVCVTKMSNE